jgi:hypothetical protein
MVPDGRYVDRQGEFPHIYWIAGGSCSGKSSVADRLAGAHGLQVLHTDSLVGRLWQRADPGRHPTVVRLWPTARKGFLHWMQLPPEELLGAGYEVFDLLLEEVEALGPRPALVEGMAVSLAAVTEVSPLDRIVCLTGTDSFLRSQERQHPFVLRHYSSWDDPERTLSALIEGHIRLTHQYNAEAERYGVRNIITEEATRFEDKLRQVSAHFGLQ